MNSANRYKSIGLHRRSRYIGASVSRSILEQGIFRLSEKSSQTFAMAKVLDLLGFRDTVTLRYGSTSALREIQGHYRQRDLPVYLRSVIGSIDRLNGGSALVQELRKLNNGQPDRFNEFNDVLMNSFDLLESQFAGENPQITLGLSGHRPSNEYALLQALALLRRLNLIRLKECQLKLKTGPAVDLAKASSGQQQMLCSIFGLVAELQSDSLVLIDEPELSLHPIWQQTFLERLKSVLEPFSGCHVLVATHSPLIVQMGREMGLHVLSLRTSEQGSSASTESYEPLESLSVEETLINVFETPISGSTFLANEIFSIVSESEGGVGVSKEGALQRLKKLQSTYSHSQGDSRALSMLDKAIDLVMSDDGATDDE